jgi:hypothetical protein
MIVSMESVVAESAGVPIFASKGIRALSFTNSPYYAHAHLGAVDLYPAKQDDRVLSPVIGRVVGIREIKAQHQDFSRAEENEKLLLISNDAETVTKILHLAPFVGVGDNVDVSEEIGNYVRSGFFGFWTPNHIHVEVRPARDPIRARGAYLMVPALPESNNNDVAGEGSSDFNCATVAANPGFLLLKPSRSVFGRIGGFSGISVIVDEKRNAILDGGFPHYGKGGILVACESRLEPGQSVRIGSLKIGEISTDSPIEIGKGVIFALVDFGKRIGVGVSGASMRGLSLSLNLSPLDSCLLRAIPHQPLAKDALARLTDNVILSIRNIDT